MHLVSAGKICYSLKNKEGRRPGKEGRLLKKRILSAVILLSITFCCVLLSEVTRVLFLAAAGILCCYELSRQLEKLEVYCSAWVMYVYIASQAVLALFHARVTVYLVSFLGAVYLAMFSGILRKRVSGNGALDTVAGLGYPGFLFAVLLMISVSPHWLKVLTLGCISSWMCDTAALVGGTALGKHKLAPHISPNKTVEGALCGALSSIPTGALLALLPFMDGVSVPLGILTAFIASSLGQVGDLAESMLKRMIGIKDFSDLIPGHGGVFDRADALLFSIPAAYICLYVAGAAR